MPNTDAPRMIDTMITDIKDANAITIDSAISLLCLKEISF